MKYKGLLIPEIHLDKLKLEISEDDIECVVNYTIDEEVSCASISGMACLACIFHKDNISKSMDYLIEKGYLTKEEALTFELGK